MDQPAASPEALQRSLIFIRRIALDLHDWFQQNRTGFFEGIFQGENACHTKREFVRIHFMERAVRDLDLDVNDLVAGIHAAFDGFFRAEVAGVYGAGGASFLKNHIVIAADNASLESRPAGGQRERTPY